MSVDERPGTAGAAGGASYPKPAVQGVHGPRRLRFGLGRVRDLSILIVIAVLFLVLTFTSPSFLTTTNLLNVASQWSPVAIMAIGGTFVLIVRGFDLSVAAIFVLSAVVATRVSQGGVPAVPALAAGVLAGTLAGAANGLLTTKGRINPFVTTIVTSIVFGGLASLIANGNLLSSSGTGFTVIGQNDVLGISVLIWIFAVFAVTGSVLLNKTTFGRYTFATGSNREAARLAGVRVDLITATTFVISGLAAGLGGMMVASQTGTATTSIGSATLANVFAAMLLGGNSILGGEGAIWRTIAGAVLIALIGNGFNLWGVNPIYQQMTAGVIILAAVAADVWFRRKTANYAGL